jgi:GH15 family glucan-1,4-alpha-glucosidase
MPDYQFSWFRDGAYIAYALTQDGLAISATHKGSMAAQWESAARFHNWCAAIISARREKLERTIERARRGEPPEISDTLHARYHADGTEGPDSWPEFQLDGPGTWLWSLKEYTDRAGVRPLPAAWERAVVLVADYLAALWRTPCYDCWEERGTDIHISTLGAIYAGLKAAQALAPECDFEQTLQAIRTFVLEHGLTPGGELAKSVGLDMVDASLLSVAVPHGMLNVDDPIMRRTVARIERELLARRGGVHRHLQDTYYGGGDWVLLALWLAWYYIELGETGRAKLLVEWAKKQADPVGNLPEQVDSSMLHPSFYDSWVAQRGPIANPLLWTHAQYLIVRRHVEA